MKTIKNKILISVSLSLNFLLVVAYYLKPVPVIREINTTALAQSASKPAPLIERVTTNIVTVVTPAAPLDWRSVESDDYQKYVTNLRGIGCPEKTIRDIIIADANELFRNRAKEAMPGRCEYWKPGNLLGNAFDETRLAKQKELAGEKRELLKTLLGDSYNAQADPSAAQIISPMEQLTGEFLTPEQQVAMKQLEVKYAGSLIKTHGDNQAMIRVQAEKDAETLTVLSPEEKFEYDLRLSQPAMMLRMLLGEFEPTEKEFRDIFKVMKEVTDESGVNGPASASQDKLLSGFKTALGDGRFQEFQKGSVHFVTSPK